MYSYSTELLEIELIICIKMDLAFNNLPRLICHKFQPTNQPTNYSSELSKTLVFIWYEPALLCFFENPLTSQIQLLGWISSLNQGKNRNRFDEYWECSTCPFLNFSKNLWLKNIIHNVFMIVFKLTLAHQTAWTTWLGLQNTSTTSLQRCKTPHHQWVS